MTWATKSHTLREEAQQNELGEYIPKSAAENLNGLFQLSLLLTGDHEKAQQCVVAGIEEFLDGNRAFNQWASFLGKTDHSRECNSRIEASTTSRPVTIGGDCPPPASLSQRFSAEEITSTANRPMCKVHSAIVHLALSNVRHESKKGKSQ